MRPRRSATGLFGVWLCGGWVAAQFTYGLSGRHGEDAGDDRVERAAEEVEGVEVERDGERAHGGSVARYSLFCECARRVNVARRNGPEGPLLRVSSYRDS